MKKKQEYNRRIDDLIWIYEHQSKRLTALEKWQKFIECKSFEITEEEKELLKEKLKINF
jgi:hypothetical protein